MLTGKTTKPYYMAIQYGNCMPSPPLIEATTSNTSTLYKNAVCFSLPVNFPPLKQKFLETLDILCFLCCV